MEASITIIAVCQIIMAIAAIVFIGVGVALFVLIYRIKQMTEKTLISIDNFTKKANYIADDAGIIVKQLRETTTNISGKIESIVENVEKSTKNVSSAVSGISERFSSIISPIVLNVTSAIEIGLRLFGIVKTLFGSKKK